MTDYYKVLGCRQDAVIADIHRGYRRVALKFHPQRQTHLKGSALEAATAQFVRAAEAYSVLSSPQLRALYDQCGEQGLKDGVPNGKGGTSAPWSFDADPLALFVDVFGASSPYNEFFGGGNSGTESQQLFGATAQPGTRPKQTDGDSPDADGTLSNTNGVEPVHVNVHASLEELYAGAVKIVPFSRRRRVVNAHGDGTTTMALESATVTVHIAPGWMPGTRLTFAGRGHVADVSGGGDGGGGGGGGGSSGSGKNSGQRGDVIVTVQHKPHPRFHRRGRRDLVYPVSVSLCDALCGCVVDVVTLDGRVVPVKVAAIVAGSGSELRVPGEGMRGVNSNNNGSEDGSSNGSGSNANGDLYLKFDVVMPDVLTAEQMAQLRQVLTPPPSKRRVKTVEIVTTTTTTTEDGGDAAVAADV